MLSVQISYFRIWNSRHILTYTYTLCEKKIDEFSLDSRVTKVISQSLFDVWFSKRKLPSFRLHYGGDCYPRQYHVQHGLINAANNA